MKEIDDCYFVQPEKHIPQGGYCYDGKVKCPFWDKDDAKPEMENGYCHFLKLGDWETNAKTTTIVYVDTGEKIEVEGFPSGLLWDQVKECGINDNGES